MNLTGQQTLPVSQADAWAALNDTAILQAAVPGCEAITPAGRHAFDVRMAVSIGPLKARFKAKLRLADLDPPKGYRLRFEGSGGAAGHGKGQALVALRPLSAHRTQLSYDVTASMGGKFAQIGAGLVDLVAQKLAEDFFARLQAALAELHPRPATAPAPAPAALSPDRLQRLRGWLRRLFA